MLWPKKKPQQPHDRSRLIGVDLNASRARGISVTGGHTRPVFFEAPEGVLPQFLSLEHRTPEIGRAAERTLRTTPHLICSNFLPLLGVSREWRGARTLNPESALGVVFDKMRGPLANEGEQLAMVLPSYLSLTQVRSVAEIAGKSRWHLKGTASLPLAIVAHRAQSLLHTPRSIVLDDKTEPDWVVPIRTNSTGPGTVLILDADEYSMSMTLVSVAPDAVRFMASHSSPRLSLKIWQDRLIDSISDRCVRLCRRDPRDSAQAEQALFEQLNPALERMRTGQSFTLSIRSERWYQDLDLQPLDCESWCAGLARNATEEFQALLSLANLPMPLRAIWMTDAAARLPGLAASIYVHTSEQTTMSMLPIDAGAEAATALLVRWLTETLPRTHLDGVIPLELSDSAFRTNSKPAARTRSQ